MGLLDVCRPILGYVIGICILMIMATLSFMAPVKDQLSSSGVLMSELLVIVALLTGVASASKAAEDA